MQHEQNTAILIRRFPDHTIDAMKYLYKLSTPYSWRSAAANNAEPILTKWAVIMVANVLQLQGERLIRTGKIQTAAFPATQRGRILPMSLPAFEPISGEQIPMALALLGYGVESAKRAHPWTK